MPFGNIGSLVDRCGHFICFSKTNAHLAAFVANNHESAESEPPTALYDFGDPLDGYDTFLEFAAFSSPVAAVHDMLCYQTNPPLRLKYKALFTRAIGQCLDTAVIQVSAPVKNDL